MKHVQTPPVQDLAPQVAEAHPAGQGPALPAQAVSALAFPLALTGAIGLSLSLPARGAAPELALLAVLLSSLAWVWLAECVAPYETSLHPAASRDHAVDGTSMALMMAVVDPLLKALWPVVVVALWGLLGRPEGLGLFEAQQPLVLKLPAALLLAGLGEYGLHRLSHRWPPMWGFHALHHSAQRIYWLNGFRSHPVNVTWHQLGGYAVLLFLGVDAQTLLTFSALSITVAAFQHANAKLRLGPMNHLFSPNALHRWHHDARPGHSQVNFGSVLSVWDRVFGTYFHSTVERPRSPGLDAASAAQVPKDRYWAQFFGPLLRLGAYATDVDKESR